MIDDDFEKNLLMNSSFCVTAKFKSFAPNADTSISLGRHRNAQIISLLNLDCP